MDVWLLTSVRMKTGIVGPRRGLQREEGGTWNLQRGARKTSLHPQARGLGGETEAIPEGVGREAESWGVCGSSSKGESEALRNWGCFWVSWAHL